MKLVILLTFFSSLVFSSGGILMTSSHFDDVGTIVGTGYVVAVPPLGSQSHIKCEKQCRYFAVTTAHHMGGRDVRICEEDMMPLCYAIKKESGRKLTLTNSSRDVAVYELEYNENLVPFAYLFGELLLVQGLGEIKETKEGLFSHIFNKINHHAVLASDEGAYALVPRWSSRRPFSYDRSSFLERSHKLKTLAVSGNKVAPLHIVPGQSGSPLLSPLKETGFLNAYEIIGHSLSYHRYANQSTFLNKAIIVKTIRDLHSGTTGLTGKMFNDHVQWKFNTTYGTTFRSLEKANISEIAVSGIDQAQFTTKKQLAGTIKIGDSGDKKQGDGGDKKQGDGGDKKQGDGGDKKQGDGGDKKQGDGGDKKQGDGGDKKQGDGGDKKQSDGGDKKQGDGGDKKQGDRGDKKQGDGGCNQPEADLDSFDEVDLKECITGLKETSILPGVLYKGEVIQAFELRTKGLSIPIYADWESILLADRVLNKATISPLRSQGLHRIVKERLSAQSSSCKTKLKCQVIKGKMSCASLEIVPEGMILSYGTSPKNLFQIHLNQNGIETETNSKEFDPLKVKRTKESTFFLDITGLFYIDLTNTYTNYENETTIQAILRSYKNGPSLRISQVELNSKKMGYLSEIRFNSCDSN